MQIYRLITGVFLSLSIVSTGFFAMITNVQAGEGKCGDSASVCQEPQTPNQPIISIQYTIENKTNQAIRFALPTGKIYELAPGQKGTYQNTLPANRLRLFIVGTGQHYPLRNGNYQFRKDSSGKTLFARVTASRRTNTRIHRVSPSPQRSHIRVLTNLPNRVGTAPEKKTNITDSSTEATPTEHQEPETPDLESHNNSESNLMGLEIIREIAGIVKTAITTEAETEQKRIEAFNHQSTAPENSDNTHTANDSLGNTQKTATTTNLLPETPPAIREASSLRLIAQTNIDTDSILAKWGWTKVECLSENPVVTITGLSDRDLCVNPTENIPVGKYEYNRSSHQLTPINQQ
ncbi:hypothetical protein NIES4101_65360 [Calothrix sp. NIES-4101]|nr:hypothetical protein NIES4101_65360 [Calothrix sp. NIES-4101]